METLYLFNPENDMALACNAPYYMPSAHVRKMAADLSVLPAWYAEEGTSVWINSSRHAKLMEEQCPLVFPVRWQTELSPIYNKVCPWGWSPALVRRLIEDGVHPDVCPSADQLSRIRQLSGRQTAVGVLRHLRGLFPSSTLGEARMLYSLSEVNDFIRIHSHVMLKAPWSGSGRGVQPVSGELSASLNGWVEHVFRTQGVVIGEPFYERVLDFAMEFFCDATGCVHKAGYSLFETDIRGGYKENLLASDEVIVSRLATYVPENLLCQLGEQIRSVLERTLSGSYQGYCGVDMMICRNQDSYMVHPCVEINLRMNMGVVSRLLFDRYVYATASGRYVIEHYPVRGEAVKEDLRLRQQYPLLLDGGRVRSGYVSLTTIAEDTSFQAYMIIE